MELTEKEEKELKPIEKVRLVMTRNKDDEKDLYDMLGTKEDRKEFINSRRIVSSDATKTGGRLKKKQLNDKILYEPKSLAKI